MVNFLGLLGNSILSTNLIFLFDLQLFSSVSRLGRIQQIHSQVLSRSKLCISMLLIYMDHLLF